MSASEHACGHKLISFFESKLWLKDKVNKKKRKSGHKELAWTLIVSLEMKLSDFLLDFFLPLMGFFRKVQQIHLCDQTACIVIQDWNVDKTGWHKPNLDLTGCDWNNLTSASKYAGFVNFGQSQQEEFTFWEGSEKGKKSQVTCGELSVREFYFGYTYVLSLYMYNIDLCYVWTWHVQKS